MSKPKRIEYGEHKGKIYCTQYACKNNYGVQTGLVHDSAYPSGCCKLEYPRISEFDNDVWGCSDERYGNEIDNSKVEVLDDKCKVMDTDYCKNECPIGKEAREKEENQEEITPRIIDVTNLNRWAEEHGFYGNKVTDYLPR